MLYGANRNAEGRCGCEAFHAEETFEDWAGAMAHVSVQHELQVLADVGQDNNGILCHGKIWA